MAPIITSIIPISMMRNEVAMTTKLAKSSITTKTEKTSRNIPVQLVIFGFGDLGGLDKDDSVRNPNPETMALPVCIRTVTAYRAATPTSPDDCLECLTASSVVRNLLAPYG
jgi:hypothetical protein